MLLFLFYSRLAYNSCVILNALVKYLYLANHYDV